MSKCHGETTHCPSNGDSWGLDFFLPFLLTCVQVYVPIIESINVFILQNANFLS